MRNYIFCFLIIIFFSSLYSPYADSNGIIISRFSTNEKVTNGQAYEKATFDISKYDFIIVPENTIVKEDKSLKSTIHIYLEKELMFAGHPPYPMHIENARYYMGCSYIEQENRIKMATFGEWQSKEGGAGIRMVIVKPEGIELEKESGLSGTDSLAHRVNRSIYMELLESQEFENCYWYGPIAPDAERGWRTIHTEIDYNLTAKIIKDS